MSKSTKSEAPKLVSVKLAGLKNHTLKATATTILYRDPADLMGGVWIAKAKLAAPYTGGDTVVMREGQASYYADRYGFKTAPYGKAPKASKSEPAAPTPDAPAAE